MYPSLFFLGLHTQIAGIFASILLSPSTARGFADLSPYEVECASVRFFVLTKTQDSVLFRIGLRLGQTQTRTIFFPLRLKHTTRMVHRPIPWTTRVLFSSPTKKGAVGACKMMTHNRKRIRSTWLNFSLRQQSWIIKETARATAIAIYASTESPKLITGTVGSGKKCRAAFVRRFCTTLTPRKKKNC